MKIGCPHVDPLPSICVPQNAPGMTSECETRFQLSLTVQLARFFNVHLLALWHD
jgi:hypothetical protein